MRFDQVFYPFYKGDIEAGRLTREQALEFIECAWIKMDELGGLRPPGLLEGGAGNNQNQALIIGGVTSEGDDATNELTHLAMEATLRARTLQPLISLRYHDKVPSDVLYKAMDLLRTGHGMPSFFNDKTIIPHIMSRHGVSLEDARNYGIVACVAWGIPGKNMMATSPQIGYQSAGKFLELALNRGVDPNDGRQLGYPTPDPSRFKCIEDVMDGYLKQVGFFAEKICKVDKIANTLNSQYIQRPFLSTLFDDCIERGEDCTSWAFYHYPTTVPVGLINVADSMAAIKKFVFDDKSISMEDLVKACRDNFEGKEELRKRLIREAPKYGNDDDYVDLFAREVHVRHNREFMRQTNYLGYPYYLNGSVVTEHFTQGLGTGALPDGRLAGMPFADGTISPMVGRDTKGPTAVLQSVSKVDPMGSFAQLLNQRFMPQYLEGDNKQLFAAYLKTWSDLGIWHIQFNVVDSEVLRDAQKHPERYQDLVVRVAGFSAYFLDLSTTVQDEIIARTEQRF